MKAILKEITDRLKMTTTFSFIIAHRLEEPICLLVTERLNGTEEDSNNKKGAVSRPLLIFYNIIIKR